MNTMVQFWRFMDDKYGKPTEISYDRISYPQKFAYSRDAKTVAQKFREMYACFNEVYNDMWKIMPFH